MLVAQRLALPWLVVAGLRLQGSSALKLHEPEEVEETSLYLENAGEVELFREADGIDESIDEDFDESSTRTDWSAEARVRRTSKDIRTFGKAYRKMRSLERRANESMPKEVQLAIGVFTISAEVPHREIVRETWMNQTGVCDLLKGKKKGCSVYAAFVMGKYGNGVLRGEQRALAGHVEADVRKEPNTLVLNIRENMNEGKTEEFFKVVAARYPWLTHVAKCDMDTYPSLHKLVDKIHNETQCVHSPYMYAGRPASCAPEGCDEWLKDNAIGNVCDVDGGCAKNYITSWTHNLGQLYVLSMPLVKKLAFKGSLWDTPPAQTHEDVTTGWAVNSFIEAERRAEKWRNGTKNATRNAACVHVWHPRAWCHRGTCKDSFFDDS